ncbi:MAG: hypothetical protein CUN56_04960 [Phototrophicales bacterium]|nr:MAG: hypothetical protein CUN56_04960 [Phototrophicales bacterium]
MRWLLLICLLATACTVDQDATPVLLQELPTRVVLPSNTPSITPRPSRTATKTASPFPPTATLTPSITPTTMPLVEVIIAVEPIPQGYAIPPSAVRIFSLPPESVPLDAAVDLDEVINHVARVPIGCFDPISIGTLAPREAGSGYLDLPGNCPPVPEEGSEMGHIVVAVNWIQPGQVISPSMVMLRDYPHNLIPPDAITRLSDVIGRQVGMNILREQPIHSYHLMPDDAP